MPFIPVLGLLLAGGAVYQGIKTYLRQKSKPPPDKEADAPLPACPGHFIHTWIAKVDDVLQTLIQKNIDPLLSGKTRQKQIEALRSYEESALPALSSQEKEYNRYMGVSCAIMVTAAIAAFSPLFMIPTLVMITLLMISVYRRVFTGLFKEKRVTMDLLASLYMSGFFVAGYCVFGGFAETLYFLGNKIVFQMEGRSREKLLHLFGQQPRFVWLVRDDVEVSIPFDQLRKGDIIVVNAGEPIPADGEIISGIASIDQQMLTGESHPVEKEVGDTVLASTLLLNGRIHIRVDQAGSNTIAAQIGQILNQSAEYHTETESRGIGLANKTVVPYLALGALALPLRGFTGSVAVLGSGFGFNIRTISLLSMMSYLNIASRHHILIKDGRALETLKRVDTFVFDKTGTLTLDQPHVAGIHIVQAGMTETDLLTYAAAAEYRQQHPVARAILAETSVRNLALPVIDEASYEVGYGIRVKIEEDLIRVGSGRFMAHEGLPIPESLQRLQTTCQSEGHTIVMVAVNEEVAGALELHGTIRPEALEVAQDLRRRKLDVMIISGDHEAPTLKLAEALGIETYFADTLPESKADLIQRLQQEGRVVCFVGDGINDAIALKQADVSISLCGATTIATDTAQIILMDGCLNDLAYLLDMADQFDRTIRTGLATTVVPALICVSGVFLAGFGIYTAEILFQLGFFSGLGTALLPLLDKKEDPVQKAPSPPLMLMEEASQAPRSDPTGEDIPAMQEASLA